MTNHKNATLVASALRHGILPHYLKRLFWEAARHNLITYLQKRKAYLTAVYDLADACYYGCFTDLCLGKQIFEADFPETPELLKEEIDLALVETASVILVFERIQDSYKASNARNHFKRGFDSAKLLGIIPENTTYKSFFERGEKISAATETGFRERMRKYIRSFDE